MPMECLKVIVSILLTMRFISGFQYSDKFLLFADSVRRDYFLVDILATDVSHQPSPLTGLVNPIAIDYNPLQKTVYITDVEGVTHPVIIKLLLSGTEDELLGSLKIMKLNPASVPDGIAVDYLSGNVFYTDTGFDRISVMNLELDYHKSLIYGEIEEPRAITLDAIEGYIYWTDWGSTPKIEKAAMDGSERRTLIDTNLKWPNGITLDYHDRKLYWCDGGLNTIERSDLDGSSREELVHLPEGHFFGIAVDEDFVYITGWDYGTVVRISKVDSAIDFIGVEVEPARLNGLVLVSSYSIQEGPNPCSFNNGGCSQLCVAMPHNLSMACLCEDGSILANDGKTCVLATFKPALYLVDRQNSIYVADVQSQEVVALRIGGHIGDITYDNVHANLFWLFPSLQDNISPPTLNQHCFNASESLSKQCEAVIKVFNAGSDPRHIAIDEREAILYVTEHVEKTIHVIYYDGQSSDLVFPIGSNMKDLVFDTYDRHLYWISEDVDIARKQVDSNDEIEIIQRGSVEIKGICIDIAGRRLVYTSDTSVHILNLENYEVHILWETWPSGLGVLDCDESFVYVWNLYTQQMVQVGLRSGEATLLFAGRFKDINHVALVKNPHDTRQHYSTASYTEVETSESTTEQTASSESTPGLGEISKNKKDGSPLPLIIGISLGILVIIVIIIIIVIINVNKSQPNQQITDPEEDNHYYSVVNDFQSMPLPPVPIDNINSSSSSKKPTPKYLSLKELSMKRQGILVNDGSENIRYSTTGELESGNQDRTLINRGESIAPPAPPSRRELSGRHEPFNESHLSCDSHNSYTNYSFVNIDSEMESDDIVPERPPKSGSGKIVPEQSPKNENDVNIPERPPKRKSDKNAPERPPKRESDRNAPERPPKRGYDRSVPKRPPKRGYDRKVPEIPPKRQSDKSAPETEMSYEHLKI